MKFLGQPIDRRGPVEIRKVQRHDHGTSWTRYIVIHQEGEHRWFFHSFSTLTEARAKMESLHTIDDEKAAAE